MTPTQKNKLLIALNNFKNNLLIIETPKTTTGRIIFYQKIKIIDRNLTSIEKQLKKL